VYFLPLTNIFWILADLLQVVFLLIIVEVIVSWGIMFGSISPYKPWVRTLRKITDPILEPFRKLVPPQKLRGFDVSPLIAIVLIQILQGILFKMGQSG
jgi:YggT family protein